MEQLGMEQLGIWINWVYTFGLGTAYGLRFTVYGLWFTVYGL